VHHLKMKAYSVDLREKIVAAVRGGMSKAQAARTFGVGATSVKRYVKLAEEGKPLPPGKAPAKKGKKLDGSGMKLLEEDLRSRPASPMRGGPIYSASCSGLGCARDGSHRAPSHSPLAHTECGWKRSAKGRWFDRVARGHHVGP
jgi:transposase-like protein